MAQEPNFANWDPLKEIPDLTGKVAFISGGNSGLGRETVKWLALRGAKVYLGTRDKARTQAAISELKSQHESIQESQLNQVHLDLGDVTSAVGAAEAFKKQESRLDILILNAAVTGDPPRTEDEESWEAQIAGDLACHFLLTNQLLPLLKATAQKPSTDVRIVGLSSAAASSFLPAAYKPNFTSPDVLANPVSYYPWSWRWVMSNLFTIDMIAYSVAKVAVTVFIKELQRHLDEEDIPVLCTAIHPGEVRTGQSLGSMAPWIRGLAQKSFLPLEEGSSHSIFAATAPQVRQNAEAYKGKFLLPLGQVAQHHPLVDDDELVKGLWKNTEGALNKLLEKKGLQKLLSW
ncbi:hypothetical protein ACHAQA_000551 [Verticillium albo-atrum]